MNVTDDRKTDHATAKCAAIGGIACVRDRLQMQANYGKGNTCKARLRK